MKTKLTLNLLETIVRISKSASTDQTRPNINVVHVIKRGDSILVEAVDGYILARQELVGDISSISEEGISIWSHDMPNLKKFIKTHKAFNTFYANIESHKITIYPVGLSDSLVIGLTEREFPRVDIVIPKDRPNTVTVGINPEYLMTLFESLKTDKRQCNVELSFDLNNLLAPVTVKVLNNVKDKDGNFVQVQAVNQTGVIMGVKTDNMGIKGKLAESKKSKKSSEVA
jgi:DNA polymerase III sliding clamp (beta) subunit (PCNA family)